MKKEIEELRKEIEHHNFLYYTKNSPEISDKEFDEKLEKLKQLEEKYPEYRDENSPTQRVGEKPLGFLPTDRHSRKMYSLDNTYNFEEVEEFFDRVRKVFPEERLEFSAELKMDGTACVLHFENGQLKKAVTRGDGELGNVITHAARTIKNIPLRIPEKKALEIRGEIYLPRSAFEKINLENKAKEEKIFSNPRNAAAGSLQILDAKIIAKRNLKFLPWEIISDDFEKHSEAMQYLHQNLLFDLNPALLVFTKTTKLEKHFEKLKLHRHEFDFEFDGLVIKVNDYKKQRLLGYTSKFPRFSVALKFPATQKTSTLKKIEIQIGRTGTFTPVAHLEPVELDGAMISRASLYNEDEIKRLNIRVGDQVLVERAGDVIPKVIKVVKSGPSEKFIFPKKCPICGSPGVKDEKDVVRRCVNYFCPAVKKGNVLHFISRNAMDIKTLGKKQVEQMFEKGLIKDFTDLYFLKKEEISSLERMAEKSAQNVLDELEKSKTRPLRRLIFALGIRFVGTRAAEILAEKFKNIEKLKEASLEELNQIHEIGGKTATSVVEFFTYPENEILIERLKEAGIRFDILEKNESKKIFDGESFVFTGTLSVSREKAKTLVRNLGGRPISSLSKSTSFLVAGKNSGSKLEKARNLNVAVLSEEDFVNKLGKDNFAEIT